MDHSGLGHCRPQQGSKRSVICKDLINVHSYRNNAYNIRLTYVLQAAPDLSDEN